MRALTIRAFSRWTFGFLVIASFGAVLAFFVYKQSAIDYDNALENYRKQSMIEAQENAKNIGHSFAYIYQGIRTISLLPSIKSIDRHGKNLDTNARESIVQIYNNMASNVAVSEIYIVPLDIDPIAIDPVTGKNQEPILMFDDKIAGKEADTQVELKEVEIYEYKLMREQMAYLKQYYPEVDYAQRLNIPFISGPEIITCDNTEYSKTGNDADRTGMVLSVPFYSRDGALKGTVSAIIRSNVLKNLMPAADHALINPAYHFTAMANIPGQAERSSEWVKQNKADPGLLFSAVIPIATADPHNSWALWTGFGDEKFMQSADVKAARDFAKLGYGFVSLLMLLSAAVWEWQRRNSIGMEHKIGSRTIELKQTMELMNLLKSVATAANEADTINEGFQIAVDRICEYTGWAVGHAYLYSKDKQKLVSLDVWHLKEPERYADFRHISDDAEFASHEDFLGEVFADSTPMWVLDVAHSSIYERKAAATDAGLKAAFGFPVFIGRKAVAVIEFYSTSTQIPDENLLSTMGNIGKQLGQVIERVETMKSLQHANLKMEEAAQHLQESLAKAHAANIAKSDFLANMSHELRTPMNGVLGMAHLLADSKLDEEQKELVSTINSSAENLLMLLNDILDFSKIEAGALELENVAFAFTDLLLKTGNLLRPQAEKKNIDFMVHYESEVPSHLWGDPGRIRQIIINLVGNAIKFTDRGHVKVKAMIEDTEAGEVLHVSVEDTGVGIPADKMEEIFEKFTQADATITRKYGGTGLGLAITKQLVSLMGGKIGVNSAVGKGSTFWFTLPFQPASAADEVATIEHLKTIQYACVGKMPVSEARVLLVDDYHVNQVFAEKLLQKFGFRHIDKAENGFEALLKCDSNNYDIIFMDCQMPKLDGYVTTQEIRAREASGIHHVIIVAMTANAMVGDREKCLNAGMDDYLSKPLRVEHMRKAIENWFTLDDHTKAISAKKPDAHKTNETQEAPVDLEQFRLFTDGDPAEEKALAELFLEQAGDMISLLENHTDKAHAELWKSAAHRFKGSSGNLGAMKLHHLCKHAETHYEAPNSAKTQMLAAIIAETKRVGAFLGKGHS